ncbi:LysR family transcriptional regulator [Roseomonas sp. HJA6]|uniref:LysR family transcriptional regulator n=1 Tax=Roseomonas alba TaxID=2846776 RepID=A0ABS7A4F2_9PROT|nr:LysR family transcriptional regulator [Neoroseomonas alba]MBW6397179.1 LysR family transcriptional regulator [Neoroseomonas alba]
MEFRTLRAFVEVVRQGGFSQAAKTLFATQSAVSKAVKQLEEEVGVPLLDRIGHRSTMTAAGEAVYRRAVRLLAERDDLGAEIAEIRGLQRGVLRLGLPPIGAATVFAPIFAAYRRRYPGIEIRLVEHGSDRLEEVLRAGDIELAASLLPVVEDFESQPLRCEPLVALLPQDHALAGRGRIGLAALREEPFILFEAGFALNRIILAACRRIGFDPAVAVRSSQIDFIIELAAAGLGVAFLPKLISEQRPQAQVARLMLDDPAIDWDMAMIWRRGAFLSHAARAWLEVAKEIGEERRAAPNLTRPEVGGSRRP